MSTGLGWSIDHLIHLLTFSLKGLPQILSRRDSITLFGGLWVR